MGIQLTTTGILNKTMNTAHKSLLFAQILKSQNPPRVMQRAASAPGKISSSL